MPIRTCVSCRKQAEKSELIRFVMSSPEPEAGNGRRGVVGDFHQQFSGRGAYCHPTASCLKNEKVLGALVFHLQKASKTRRKEKPAATKDQKAKLALPSDVGQVMTAVIDEMLKAKPRKLPTEKPWVAKLWTELAKLRAEWDETTKKPALPKNPIGRARGRVRM